MEDPIVFEWGLYWNAVVEKFVAFLLIDEQRIPCLIDTGSSHLVLRRVDLQQPLRGELATCAQEPILLSYTGGQFAVDFLNVQLERICLVPAGVSMSEELPRASLWGMVPIVEQPGRPLQCASSITCLLDKVAAERQTSEPAIGFDLLRRGAEKTWLGAVPSLHGRIMQEIQLVGVEEATARLDSYHQAKLYVKVERDTGIQYLLLDTGTTYTKVPEDFPVGAVPLTQSMGPNLMTTITVNRQPRHPRQRHTTHGMTGTMGILDMLGLHWIFSFKRHPQTRRWTPERLLITNQTL